MSLSSQWYQSNETITASVKLKCGPSSSKAQKKFTVEFKEQYFAVYEDGDLFWECHLTGKVDPDRCKICVGKVRLEIILKKTEPEQWSELEVKKTHQRSGDSGNAVSKATTNVPHSSTKRFIPEDLTFVNHVPHDFYDMGRDVAKLKIQLSGMNEKRCGLVFRESSLELKFKTDDKKFLRTHDGSTETTSFIWNIQLYDKISPTGSSFHFKPDCVDVTLKKATTVRWKTLEQTQHSGGITSTRSPPPNSKSNPTNQIQASNQPPANQKASGICMKDLNCDAPRVSRTLPLVKNDDVAITSQTKQLNDLTIDPPADPGDDVIITSSEIAATTSTISPGSSGYSSEKSNEKLTTPPIQVSGSNKSIFSKPKTVYEHRHSTPDARSTDHTPSHRPHPPLARTTSSTPQESSRTTHYAPLTSKYAKGIFPAALEVTDPSYRNDQLGKPSITGLCNLGNSCFMNSVVQCLSNTQPLRDFFVNGHYLANINRANPLGFHGDLAKSFSLVIRRLWSGEYEYFSPKKLKSVIASRSSHFGGYQQHDSHEFMSYLLDGLHEDLNRVQKKPQTSPVESEDRPDMEVAEESWKVHKLRNDSFVVDLFQGQFKSTLVCTVCSKVSVTFDPFMSMSVPLPKKLRRLPVMFVSADPDTLPVQYILNLPPEGNLELLKASVGKKTNISMTQLRVFEAYNGKFQTLLSNNVQLIRSIEDNDIIIVSEVLSRRSLKEKVVEINVIQRVQCPLFPTKCSSCGKLAKDLGEKKIQRCGKCKAVGYCDSECQRKDWSSHKMQCRQGRPIPVGLPFVISLPSSQLTYSRLASMAEKIAKFSVDVTTKVDTVKDSSAQQITENVTSGAHSENTENYSKNTEDIQEIAEGMQENTGTASQNTDQNQEITEEIQENTEIISNSTQEVTENEQATALAKPMYVFVPVDRFGDNKQETEPLKDLGSQPLTIVSQFLAMDWRNNPKDEGSVDIKSKPNLDHVKDSSCTGAFSSTSDDTTLDQCLELFTEPETLTKDEAWYCPECKEHREAIKQISVWRLPNVLILHLKRFQFYNYILRDKISKMIKFPITGLEMSPYMLGDAAKNVTPDHSATYDLYATVNHYGTVSVGHYMSCVRPPTEEGGAKDWICYDDDLVYEVSESKVLNNNAYILFYQRRKLHKRPQTNCSV